MKKTPIRFAAVILAVLLAVPAVMPAFAAGDAAEAAYVDVKTGSWYEKAVKYVSEYALMTGSSATTFEPQTPLSRAMTVLILAKLVNANLAKYASAAPEFSDVEPGRWYTAAVAWAVDNSIAVGTGTVFAVTKPVTRQELALMMYNVAAKFKIDNYFKCGPDNIYDFADAAKVSAWALEAVTWAVHNGYISGDDKSCLNPTKSATRAEAAQIFYNFHFVKRTDALPPDTGAADALTVKKSSTPRILCWGDSLTEGCVVYDNHYTYDLEKAYPAVLQSLTGIETLNYGISGEYAEQIAMRQGGYPFYVQPCVIPADTTPVEVSFEIDDRYEADFASKGLNGDHMRAGVNPVIIGGVEGTLRLVDGVGYEFTRSAPGKEVKINRLTRVITAPMVDRRSNDILVICSGSNNGPSPDNIEEIFALIDGMIEYAGVGDRYVVVDFTAYPVMLNQKAVNDAMKEHYGDHLIEMNKYFVTSGLADAGITPTATDLSDISQGHIPESLLFAYDHLHYLAVTNRLFAQQVKLKLVSLGLIAA